MTADVADGVERLSSTPEVAFPGEWYDLTAVDHFWFQWRLAAALRQWRDSGLALDAPLRVIDVGGGQGVFRDQVESATAWTVDLVDLNAPALAAARRGRGRRLYYDVSDEAPDLLAAYDAAILYDVIEHLADPQPLLRSVARHVKPSGWLLVNVPALQSLFSAYDVAAGHFRRYDRRSLPAELAGGGWDVRDVRYWGLSLVPLLFLRRLLLRNPSPDTIDRGFRPPGRLAHAGLRALMKAETTLLSRAPTGTSVLMVAQRHG
jgi:SAM-dependent methyltransferase